MSIDLERGYDRDPERVAELAVELARIGVAGVNLEDGGAEPEALAAKLSASRARLAGLGLDLFLNARADVFLNGAIPAPERVAEVVRRGLSLSSRRCGRPVRASVVRAMVDRADCERGALAAAERLARARAAGLCGFVSCRGAADQRGAARRPGRAVRGTRRDAGPPSGSASCQRRTPVLFRSQRLACSGDPIALASTDGAQYGVRVPGWAARRQGAFAVERMPSSAEDQKTLLVPSAMESEKKAPPPSTVSPSPSSW